MKININNKWEFMHSICLSVIICLINSSWWDIGKSSVELSLAINFIYNYCSSKVAVYRDKQLIKNYFLFFLSSSYVRFLIKKRKQPFFVRNFQNLELKNNFRQKWKFFYHFVCILLLHKALSTIINLIFSHYFFHLTFKLTFNCYSLLLFWY